MSLGLPVSRLITTNVTLTAAGAQYANVNSLCIVGSSDVIDTDTRIQSFSGLDEVAETFGTSVPEYLAAALFFAQSPQPTQLYIGRWAATATNGRNFGAVLSPAQKLLSNFTGITNGGFKVPIDGVVGGGISGINLSGVTNLNGVASQITAGFGGVAVCTYDAVTGQFILRSTATGATSMIGATTPPVSGIDLGPLLNLTAAKGARLVQGMAAETPLAAVTVIDGKPASFYGLMFAASGVSDSDSTNIAGYIEAAARPHIFGVNSAAGAVLDPLSTSDIASVLMAAGYTRSFVHYSSTSPYAAASLFGRALTVDFAANNSTITLMYKNEPAVTPELLTTTQANALKDKRANVFVRYDNDTAIIQYGTMAGDAYFDEIYGLDWLAGAIETDLYNVLYTSPTKIPQTDNGVNQLVNTANKTLARGVNNGLLAAGVWQSGGFGQLSTGDYLSAGFYTYAQPLALQSPADRAARKSPPIQIAAKLAGAVHTVDVSVVVNR